MTTYVLPIEIYEREIDAKLVLAAYLCSYGHSVLIGSFLDDVIRNVTSTVVVYKDHNRSGSLEKVQKWKSNNNQVVILDEEGLVISNKKRYHNVKINEKTLEICDKIYTWGDYQKKFIPSEFHYKTISIGHPKFLLSNMVRSAKNNLSEQITSNILVVSRFSKISRQGHLWDYFGQNARDIRGLDHQPFRQAEVKICREYIKLIKILHQKKYNYRFRLHPNDNPKFWQKFLPNAIYSNTTLQQDLLWSNVMIHDACTTSIEGKCAGVYTIAYRPEDLTHYDVDLNLYSDERVSSLEAALECLDKVKYLDIIPSHEKGVVRRVNNFHDPYTFVTKMLETTQEFPQYKVGNYLYNKYSFLDLLMHLENCLLSKNIIFSRRMHNYNLFNRDLKVRSIQDRMKKCFIGSENKIPDLKVEKCGPRSFQLELR